MDIGEDLAKLLGANDFDLTDNKLKLNMTIGDSYLFSLKPQKTDIHPKNLYIHCNIIGMTLLGSRFEQILGMIPISSKNSTKDEYVTVQFDNTFFKKVNVSNIEVLEFKITDYNGNNKIFMNPSKNPIYMTLKLERE